MFNNNLYLILSVAGVLHCCHADTYENKQPLQTHHSNSDKDLTGIALDETISSLIAPPTSQQRSLGPTDLYVNRRSSLELNASNEIARRLANQTAMNTARSYQIRNIDEPMYAPAMNNDDYGRTTTWMDQLEQFNDNPNTMRQFTKYAGENSYENAFDADTRDQYVSDLNNQDMFDNSYDQTRRTKTTGNSLDENDTSPKRRYFYEGYENPLHSFRYNTPVDLYSPFYQNRLQNVPVNAFDRFYRPDVEYYSNPSPYYMSGANQLYQRPIHPMCVDHWKPCANQYSPCTHNENSILHPSNGFKVNFCFQIKNSAIPNVYPYNLFSAPQHPAKYISRIPWSSPSYFSRFMPTGVSRSLGRRSSNL